MFYIISPTLVKSWKKVHCLQGNKKFSPSAWQHLSQNNRKDVTLNTLSQIQYKDFCWKKSLNIRWCKTVVKAQVSCLWELQCTALATRTYRTILKLCCYLKHCLKLNFNVYYFTCILKIQAILIAHRIPSKQRDATSVSSQSWRPTLNAARKGVHANWNICKIEVTLTAARTWRE